MDVARTFLFIDGLAWVLSGIAWYIVPRTLVKRWLGAEQVVKSTLDMTRGFGVAMVQGGAVEIYAAVAESTSRGVLDCVAITRLSMDVILLIGWVIFHSDTFYERFGFWGTIVSFVMPVGYLIASRV